MHPDRPAAPILTSRRRAAAFARHLAAVLDADPGRRESIERLARAATAGLLTRREADATLDALADALDHLAAPAWGTP